MKIEICERRGFLNEVCHAGTVVQTLEHTGNCDFTDFLFPIKVYAFVVSFVANIEAFPI